MRSVLSSSDYKGAIICYVVEGTVKLQGGTFLESVKIWGTFFVIAKYRWVQFEILGFYEAR